MVEKIGKAAMYELLAEECVELAHASLKIARIMRGENPTPTRGDEINNLEEEIADVALCLSELHHTPDFHIIHDKIDRFNKRWEGKHD